MRRQKYLNEDRIKQYLNTGGIKCPYCEGEDLKGEPFTSDTELVYQKIRCRVCNKAWLDIYTLTNVLINTDIT